ncbi:MAG TPA: protein kinase [Thermoanaerobaculia bacterium]|nr:protein kinase [Thermoanaerobaculia bacterium]
MEPDEENHPTDLQGAAPTHTPSGSGSSEGRFTPGTIIADRYRFVSLLGRGGMGEVFRAEDMKLGHPIALKFLPADIAGDPAALERLYGEVRIGRQISHPNVCRLYDIVEVEGHRFIAMEYVDGEDLASLLRRIGNLAPAKALDIARGLCAGLAAVHERGVIHRDLKPGNVMIDGRGKPRITDFGLAAVSEQPGASAGLAGTPAYMAPEQFAGKGASTKSDIYALGLILCEMFTGKQIFSGSLAEIIKQHGSSKPISVSSQLRMIDPGVERVVLRCLDEDPAARPPSVETVLAALPGGDPLAAALAAGETPSPAMVAAAGKVGDLRPALAWSYLCIVIAGTLLAAFLMGKTFRRGSPEKPPEALADRAAEIMTRAGYPDRVDSAHGFFWDRSPSRSQRQRTSEPPAVSFWYRQSPTSIVATNPYGAVEASDPPETRPGMASVQLDSRGRLLELRAVPPRFESAKGPWPEPSWNALFTDAGLDPLRFKASDAVWAAPFGHDRRAAWDSAGVAGGEAPIHVEAASFHGKPVWFQIFRTQELAPRIKKAGSTADALEAVFVLTYLVGMLGGVIFALRNARLGRGDREGAKRVALWMFGLRMLAWLFRADHVPLLNAEFGLVVIGIGRALFHAAFVWVLYMALEPYVRRRWPEMIISWSRWLRGQFRDPLVGRSILMGCLWGVGMTLLIQTALLVSGWEAFSELMPMVTSLEGFLGVRHIAWLFLLYQGLALLLAFITVFELVIFRVIAKRQSLTVALYMVVVATANVVLFDNVLVGLIVGLVQAAFTVMLTIRVGLLALFSGLVVSFILMMFPITLDFSAWYAGASISGLLLVGAIAFYGFYVSLAGKPMFGASMIEE